MEPSSSVPEEVRFGAAAALANHRKAIIAEHVQLAEKLNELKRMAISELRAALDSDQWARYEKHRQMIRHRLRDARTDRSTKEGIKLERQNRRQILMEARETTKGLGFDIGRLSQIRNKYDREAWSSVERVMPQGRAPANVVADSTAVLRAPPYIDELSGSEVAIGVSNEAGSQFRSGRDANASKVTGQISCNSDFEIHDSDDRDWAYDWTWGRVGFWFKVPVTGAVQVDVDLVALDVRTAGRLDDDYGTSDGTVRQRGWLNLITWTRHVDPTTGQITGSGDSSDYQPLFENVHEEGFPVEETIGWNDTHYAPGQRVPSEKTHLVSKRVYTPGTRTEPTWLLLDVMIKNLNWFSVNDYTCDATLTSNWFVRGISASSTGT